MVPQAEGSPIAHRQVGIRSSTPETAVVVSTTELQKSYPAVREAIAGIRHDVAAVVSFLGANEEAVDRVRLAVSEAATNIVQNVFEHTSGRIHVVLGRTPDGQIAVTVADDGNGVVQRNVEAGLGLGYIVMRECADTLKVRQPLTGGVEVEMCFSPRPAGAATSLPAETSAAAHAPSHGYMT
jgi:anti-sigma regulatory factor (Ser/Thr protein kinase)